MNKAAKKRSFAGLTIVKRDDMPKWKGMVIRVATVLVAFLLSMLLCTAVTGQNYFDVISTLFQGVFASSTSIWSTLLDAALLLGFGIAVAPCFKMKYWNMGANGQVLMGALVAIVLMFYMGSWAAESAVNNVLLILLMFVCAVAASMIWGLIPAIFKVFFNTNETLFTLMMNYVAMGLVSFVNYVLAQGKKESPGIINSATEAGYFPQLINRYFLPILIMVVLAVIIFFYLKKTKHGYEISVVGDSAPTARYSGMNTKKIVLRTIALSGIVCGIIGFLYASAINNSISADTAGSQGFTAVLVGWLSNFSIPIMAGICLFLSFLTKGTSKISSVYRLGNNYLSSVVIGIIFFSILIAEFFIRYRIKSSKPKDEQVMKNMLLRSIPLGPDISEIHGTLPDSNLELKQEDVSETEAEQSDKGGESW